MSNTNKYTNYQKRLLQQQKRKNIKLNTNFRCLQLFLTELEQKEKFENNENVYVPVFPTFFFRLFPIIKSTNEIETVHLNAPTRFNIPTE